MPVESGAPVGSYRIVALLLAAGMGEAFRARGVPPDGARATIAGSEMVSSLVLLAGVDGLGP
jgi:hypothetical protein